MKLMGGMNWLVAVNKKAGQFSLPGFWSGEGML
jgi:hypothetical protein